MREDRFVLINVTRGCLVVRDGLSENHNKVKRQRDRFQMDEKEAISYYKEINRAYPEIKYVIFNLCTMKECKIKLEETLVDKS